MPEVGKRYKSLVDGKEIEITRIEGDIFYSTDSGYSKELPAPLRFLNYFEDSEEIPSEPKQQPTWPKEIQEAMDKMKSCIDESRKIPEEHKVETDTELYHMVRGNGLILSAENLLNALEQNLEKCTGKPSEKKGFEVKMSCGLCGVEMKEVDGVHEVCNCSSGFKSVNYVCEAERSKKTSIWKDVSERPEKNDVSIIWLKDGGKVIAAYHSITGRWLLRSENRPSGFEVFLPEYIQAWCDIADFFNQAESDHVAIAELRERLDKLKGK